MDGVRGCTPTVLLRGQNFLGSGDGPVGALLVVAGSTGHVWWRSRIHDVAPSIKHSALQCLRERRARYPSAMRHYSGAVLVSSKRAVGAVGGSGGQAWFAVLATADLRAGHAELEMLDLTVGQVRFVELSVAIVTGGAITSALV